MQEVLTAGLMVGGALFMLVAALGVLRMPDLFLRLSASTKASSFGSGLILLAAAAHFADTGVTSRAVATIVFLLLTTPIAAHMLGRAGYFVGVKLSDRTVIDELAYQYDLRTHRLASRNPATTTVETDSVSPES
ncbi:MAG: monovalent cation/H(+) antiporter subunit G [Chloroflexota bacterium]|jgi:multicomponent Na+:H+ antiporter subunit G